MFLSAPRSPWSGDAPEARIRDSCAAGKGVLGSSLRPKAYARSRRISIRASGIFIGAGAAARRAARLEANRATKARRGLGAVQRPREGGKHRGAAEARPAGAEGGGVARDGVVRTDALLGGEDLEPDEPEAGRAAVGEGRGQVRRAAPHRADLHARLFLRADQTLGHEIAQRGVKRGEQRAIAEVALTRAP